MIYSDHEMSSGLSSPLTELSSLSEIEETPQPSVPKVGLFDMDELKAALVSTLRCLDDRSL